MDIALAVRAVMVDMVALFSAVSRRGCPVLRLLLVDGPGQFGVGDLAVDVGMDPGLAFSVYGRRFRLGSSETGDLTFWQ